MFDLAVTLLLHHHHGTIIYIIGLLNCLWAGMGGSSSVVQSEAMRMAKYEYLGQREKPADGSDITTLDAAIIEICKLRSLCRQVDPSFVDSVLSNISQGEKPATETKVRELVEPKCSSAKSQDKITKAVQDKFVHRLSSLHDAFRLIDIRNTGFITKQEFLSACWDWGVHLEENDIALLDTVSSGALSEINYADFIEIMGNVVCRGDLEVTSNSLSSPTLNLTDSVRETLRSRIKSSDMTMRQAFQKFDIDHSGSIDRGEMQKVLEALHVPYSPEQFEALFLLYDSNKDGQFQYFEFVKIIQQDSDLNLVGSATLDQAHMAARSNSGNGVSSPLRHDHTSPTSGICRQRDPRKENDELTQEVIRKIDSRFSAIKNCCRELDVSQTGLVSSADFLRICNHWGVALTSLDISGLSPSSETGGSGTGTNEVRYVDCTALLKEVSLSRDHSDANKQQLRSKFLDNGVTVWEIFQKYDSGHLGWVGHENVTRVLDSFNIAYSKHDFRTTISLYEREEGDGRFYYAEFCNIISRKGINFGTSI